MHAGRAPRLNLDEVMHQLCRTHALNKLNEWPNY